MVLVAASAVRTCLGDGVDTFAALLAGRSGVGDLRFVDGARINVTRGYHIDDGMPGEPAFRASRWLQECVIEALRNSGIDPRSGRVPVVVGTGLRELRAVERWAVEDRSFSLDRLHFAGAVREAAPGAAEVLTLSNACSAGGSALALGQDLIDQGEADAVVVAGTDAMTESMLAMIGRVAGAPSDAVRPFDADRSGVLLGDGAAALVLVRETSHVPPLARLLATGLSCDAAHETAPDREGIRRAMADALARAGRSPKDVALVVAHGTGTVLNDPTEAGAIRDVIAGSGPGPVVTAVKGAIGHTSGSSALVSVDVAIRCLRAGVVPPVVGLRRLLAEGEGLRFVVGRPAAHRAGIAQIDAFGFGGVNAVTLLEAA